MNQPATSLSLSAPRKAYAETRRWLDEMTQAQELDELALAWELFLIYHQRTWNKCEGLHRNTSYWSKLAGKYVPRRKAEAALVYVHQARHVDEHGISPVAVTQPATTTITSGTIMGGSVIVGGGPTHLAAGSTAGTRINSATVVACAVTNMGQQYLPPVLAGYPPGATPVLEIAKVALKFYEDLFADLDAVGAP